MTSEQIGQIFSVIIAVLASVKGAQSVQRNAPPSVRSAAAGSACPTCGRITP